MIKKNYFVSFFFLCLPILGIGQSVVKPLVPNANDLQLVFQDEFNANTLDWNVWASLDAANKTSGGLKVGRWKENAVLADGLLKLMVKKGNRPDSDWTAAFIWLKKTYGSNTYYESKFRVTNEPGINNAFWTSCIGSLDNKTRSYKNRYEIDVVEAKKYNNGDSIGGHLSWHDWKTTTYANSVNIAQGILINYNTTSFLTWGLWVGEDHFIIYCNGIEQTRGLTHKKYINQWNTGVGKLPEWPTQEEKRAYGKYGQDDWSYMGGMNGDDMNICFSTQPWSDPNSTLTDAGNNTSMDIDYLRIYKLKSDLVVLPSQTEKATRLKNKIVIKNTFDLNKDKNYYFSFVANRPVNSNVICQLKSDNKTQICLKITKENKLSILTDGTESSTDIAYPASINGDTYFGTAQKYLIVGRITASSSKKDIISFRSFQLSKSVPEREPFLYRNIDDKGNTSITNEWHINRKISSKKSINNIEFSDKANKCHITNLCFGESYLSVVSQYKTLK
jgi:hypothetical protein